MKNWFGSLALMFYDLERDEIFKTFNTYEDFVEFSQKAIIKALKEKNGEHIGPSYHMG